MNEYEINKNTLAIIPIDNNRTKIIENDDEFIINNTSFNIIDHSCRFFGSSYKGRKIGSFEIIGSNYKVPIIIEETLNIIFFPLTGIYKNTIWISLDQIKKYNKNSSGSKITFKNDYEINLDISYGSLENQILRASFLDSTLRKRRKMV